MSKEQGPSPAEMGIDEEYSDEKATNAALESKRIGFDLISQEVVFGVINKAEQGETFTVPDTTHQDIYTIRAKQMGRKDLKFVVGE